MFLIFALKEAFLFLHRRILLTGVKRLLFRGNNLLPRPQLRVTALAYLSFSEIASTESSFSLTKEKFFQTLSNLTHDSSTRYVRRM